MVALHPQFIEDTNGNNFFVVLPVNPHCSFLSKKALF